MQSCVGESKQVQDKVIKMVRPLLRQCFLTAGVSLNFAAHGIVMGFSSVLLPQLRKTDISESSATWIASIIGISILIGTLAVQIIMNTYGRKPANIISATLMTTGWLILAIAESASSLLLARFLQGLSMGILANMGNILIGECCSPENRGPFLATISLAIMSGISLVHFLGTLVSSWHTIALICSIVAFSDLVIILLSPESPSFYVLKGRYGECRKAFRWLRGSSENEELEKLIKINIAKKSKETLNDKGILEKVIVTIAYVKTTLSKREVYKPVIIALHLYGLNQWCGNITFNSYAPDILDSIVGADVSYSAVIVYLNLQLFVSNFLAILVIKQFRRKLVLSVTISANVVAYLGIGLYVYLKTHGLLGFDYPLLGLILVHLHLFTSAVGAMPLENIIIGEILPLEHRGLCVMIGIMFFSINETINIKSARYLFASIGVHGAYTMYGVFMAYFGTVAWFLLPETKDRVLHDIEEEFRGKPFVADAKLIEESNKRENAQV